MPTKAVITALLIAVCLIGNLCLGQEPSPSYEHLKFLEPFTGDWVGEYVAPSDLGPVKKGDHVTVHASQRWALNKTFAIKDFQLEVNGRKIPATHEIDGWDEKGKKAVHWIYSELGVGFGEWTEVGKRSVLRWSLDAKDGKLEGTSSAERVDENTFVFQAVEGTLAGKKLPDGPKITMRRKTGTAAGDLWKEYCDAYVGDWVTAGPLVADAPELGWSKGDQMTYRLACRPENDGTMLVGEGDFRIAGKDCSVKVRSICYWDPAAGQVRLVASWSNGAIEEAVIQGKTARGFTGTYTLKCPGSPTFRGRFRTTHSDADSYVITFLDGPRKGENLAEWKREGLKSKKLPDSKATYERRGAPSSEEQKAFLDLAECLVGVWDCDLPDLGKVEHAYRWRIKDRFLELAQKGGDGDRHAVVGIDPQTGKPTWWTYKEDGTVNVMTATPAGKGVWNLESVENGPGGHRTMSATLTRVDENRVDARVTAYEPDPDGITGRTEVYRRRK